MDKPDIALVAYWQGAAKEWHQTAIDRAQRIAELEGENERARQALEEIALETQGGIPHIERDELVHITAVDTLARMGARAALAPEEKHEGT